jgi:hypothetical protein
LLSGTTAKLAVFSFAKGWATRYLHSSKMGEEAGMSSKPDDRREILLRGRLNGQQRRRLDSLLDMMYRPSELAEEVGFNVRQVYRVYLPLGCPHERNACNHIFINGRTFREWVKSTYRKAEMEEDEAFCLTCKRPVKMVEPVRQEEAGLAYLVCTCPNCGRRLARIVENKQSQ